MNKKERKCRAGDLIEILSRQHVLVIIKTLSGDVFGFNQLQKVTNINSRTLTLRLQTLEKHEIVKSVNCTKDKRRMYYQLTLKGKKISIILKKLELLT